MPIEVQYLPQNARPRSIVAHRRNGVSISGQNWRGPYTANHIFAVIAGTVRIVL